jgi:hypothetical protein
MCPNFPKGTWKIYCEIHFRGRTKPLDSWKVRPPPTATAAPPLACLEQAPVGSLGRTANTTLVELKKITCTFLPLSPARWDCLLHSRNQAFTLAWRQLLVHNICCLLPHKHTLVGAHKSLDDTTATFRSHSVPHRLWAPSTMCYLRSLQLRGG